jgi:hypothetical protein
MGNEAIDRSTYNSSPKTNVDKNNPANASGTITSVEIYAYSALTLVEVATFFTVSGNNLSTRDTEIIGSVTAGYHQYNVNLDVVIGDFIGIYFATGSLDRSTETATGSVYVASDQIPCTNVTFTALANNTISLYGTGATLGWPHKWNTITIGKWDTVTFSKWNGLQ